MKKTLMLLLVAFLMAVNVIGQCKPTKDEFFKACDSLSIHNVEVVWAQARLESGNFTSAHFKNRNNCLGIYDSKNKRYASFESWRHCLAAYKNRVQYRCPSTEYTNEQYLDWIIKIGYASDASYKQKIQKMMRNGKQ